MKNPLRGEVWQVDLGMAAKVRPALVVSVALNDEDRALIAILPHTTSLNGTRFEVDVRARFLKPGAFDVQQLLAIPRAKFIRKLGELESDQLGSVESVIKQWLGLVNEQPSESPSPIAAPLPPPDAAPQ